MRERIWKGLGNRYNTSIAATTSRRTIPKYSIQSFFFLSFLPLILFILFSFSFILFLFSVDTRTRVPLVDSFYLPLHGELASGTSAPPSMRSLLPRRASTMDWPPPSLQISALRYSLHLEYSIKGLLYSVDCSFVCFELLCSFVLYFLIVRGTSCKSRYI